MSEEKKVGIARLQELFAATTKSLEECGEFMESDYRATTVEIQSYRATIQSQQEDIKTLREANERLGSLLEITACPNSCMAGVIVGRDGGAEGPCQWCQEYEALLSTQAEKEQ